jgi:hypothetical protein
MPDGFSIGASSAPDHFRWWCGENLFASPAQARSMDFRVDFTFSAGPPAGSFREEVSKAAAKVNERRRGRPVALCYTAGLDSDLIALELSRQGIPFTPFFLDLWGINYPAFAQNKSFLGLDVQVVRLERIQFYDEVCLPVFRQFGLENPTYLALSYLYEKIPPDFFIVAGNGDLDRTGRLFPKIAENSGYRTGQRALPFSVASAFDYLWPQWKNRAGEFAFFNSTEGLVRSMLFHSEFQASLPYGNTRRVISLEYPELPAREKTNNWDGPAYIENVWVREWLERHRRDWPEFGFWRPDGGAVWELPVGGR